MPYGPPWWYVTLRASRFGNVNFCEAVGVPYGPLVEEWLLIGESAENEARDALQEQARKG